MSSANLMRLKVIKDYLKSKFISVPDEWVLNQMNANDCNQESVYRFWLNSDLRQIPNQNSILPNDINTIKIDDNKQTPIKSTVYGEYALQINSIRDISKPQVFNAVDAIDEDESESNVNSDESDTENKNMFKRKKQKVKKETTKRGPRMLSMYLTDGVIQCKAIEYQPIEVLSADTPVGTKLVICGPFHIHTAVIFLTAKNVTLLGGNIPILTPNANGNHQPLP